MYCPQWRRAKPCEAVGSARFQVGFLAEASREAPAPPPNRIISGLSEEDLTAVEISLWFFSLFIPSPWFPFGRFCTSGGLFVCFFFFKF